MGNSRSDMNFIKVDLDLSEEEDEGYFISTRQEKTDIIKSTSIEPTKTYECETF